MTEIKHTPGPWKLCPSIEGDFLAVYPATGKIEFPIAKMPEYITGAVNAANGRLLASAPELLEALQECEEYFDNKADADHDETGFVPNKEMQLLSTVRAALAKAGAA